MAKTKLTLTVKKKIVQEAKRQGVNISEFLENLLGCYTQANRPKGNLHEAYRQLFDSILLLLEEFDCDVIIAQGDETVSYNVEGKVQKNLVPYNIYLEPTGYFYVDAFEKRFKNINRISQEDFLPPKKILSNLIDALTTSEEVRDERINEILMAKDIIDAIFKRLVKKHPTTY